MDVVSWETDAGYAAVVGMVKHCCRKPADSVAEMDGPVAEIEVETVVVATAAAIADVTAGSDFEFAAAANTGWLAAAVTADASAVAFPHGDASHLLREPVVL